MRNRVDKLGVSEPEIRKQEPDEIVIQLAGVHDQGRAAAIIGQTAQLELYDLEADLVRGVSIDIQGQVTLNTTLFDVLGPVQAKAAQGPPDEWYLVRGKAISAGPVGTQAALAAKQTALTAKVAADFKAAQARYVKDQAKYGTDLAQYTKDKAAYDAAVKQAGGAKSTTTTGSDAAPQIGTSTAAATTTAGSRTTQARTATTPGTTSSAKRPASQAAAARWWLRTA